MSSPIVVESRGVRHELPSLTPQEIIDLCERAAEREKKIALADLDLIEASEKTRAEELREIRRRCDAGVELVRSAYTVRGAKEIIEAALAKNGSSARFEDLGLDITLDLYTTALRLIGVDPERRPDKKSDPTTPETGDSKPASSPTTSPDSATP